MEKFLRSHLSPAAKKSLRSHLLPPLYRPLAWMYRDNLTHLASLFQTDKWGIHWYMQHYERYFAPLRRARLNILEIGVGGEDNPDRGGASLRMWKAYFRRSRILGIDIHDKTQFRERRIDIRQCDQTDAGALTQLSQEYGGFDIIIDDGSHLNDHVIRTFEILFPLLREGGIYSVEDTETAYWPNWGGGVGRPDSSMAYFANLVHGLNYMEYPIPDYVPTYFDRNIVEIALFHNLVFVSNGRNGEQSNLPKSV